MEIPKFYWHPLGKQERNIINGVYPPYKADSYAVVFQGNHIQVNRAMLALGMAQLHLKRAPEFSITTYEFDHYYESKKGVMSWTTITEPALKLYKERCTISDWHIEQRTILCWHDSILPDEQINLQNKFFNTVNSCLSEVCLPTIPELDSIIP